MRLIFTVIGTLSVVILCGFGLRLWGLTQPTPFYESSYFTENQLDIIAMGGASTEFAPYSLGAYREALRQNPQLILGADVFLTQDHELILADPELAHQKGGDKLLRFTNLDELEGEPLGLREFVEAFPDQRFYIELHDNVDDIHDRVVAELKGLELEHQILVRSEYDLITRGVKQYQPLWLYGSGIGEQTRYLALNSLYLEPLMDFFSDVYVSPVFWKKRRVLTPGLISELKRRKRRVFAGIIDTEEQFKDILGLDLDGVITHHPQWLQQELIKHKK